MKAWDSQHCVRKGRKEEMCNYLHPDPSVKFSPALQNPSSPIPGLPVPALPIFLIPELCKT